MKTVKAGNLGISGCGFLALLVAVLPWAAQTAACAQGDPIGSHPHIYSLSKTYVLIGHQLTIRGIDFGTAAPPAPGGVLFNYNRTTHTGMQAAIVSWSNTTIVCTVPDVGGGVNVSEVGVVTARHVAHAGAPPTPDPGATTETIGTPAMRDRVQVVIARAPYQINAMVNPTVTVVRPAGYAADPAGQARWGDTLQLTVEFRFTLNVNNYSWASWGTYNNNKPVYLYLMGPDLDPRSPGYEARFEGRMQSYMAKFPAAIESVARIGSSNNHRMYISNFSAPVSGVARVLCIGPYAGNDSKWGWQGTTRDDIPWTPGEWRLVGVMIPETLYFQNTGGAQTAVDTHAQTVTTFTGRRVAFDATWNGVEDPYIVTVLHPLDVRASADAGANWDWFDRVSGTPSTANGNDHLIPALPVGTIPRLWFSRPLPLTAPPGQPTVDEGALPGKWNGLWDGYKDVGGNYQAMQIVNQSHLNLRKQQGGQRTRGVGLEVPELRIAPLPYPVASALSDAFYGAYAWNQNPSFPPMPRGSVAGSAAFYVSATATNEVDPTAEGIPLLDRVTDTGGQGIARITDMGLQVPVNQPSVALPLGDTVAQWAYYATTLVVDPWTRDGFGRPQPVDPQPSLGGTSPADYPENEQWLYDPSLARVFVNSDGSVDSSTGKMTADLANLGLHLDLSTVDVANTPEDALGYWNLNYNENFSKDPFGWLYEEAYRSFILALSVRESWDVRVFGSAWPPMALGRVG